MTQSFHTAQPRRESGGVDHGRVRGAVGRAGLVFESHLFRFRSMLASNLMGAFVQPFLYLLAMGVGVGSLVDARPGSSATLGGTSYFDFFAPSVLATSAMMLGAQSALWPVMDGFKWQRHYFAQHDTPLSPTDILAGQMLFDVFRCLISAIGVAAALAWYSGTRSWGLIPAVAFAGLTGLAFASPLTAWAATRQREISFPSIMRFGITPLFLFGGAFFPIDQLPGWMQPVAFVTPLWHGIQLCRGSVLGTLGLWPAVGHCVYLAGFVTVGFVVARGTFRKRLSA